VPASRTQMSKMQAEGVALRVLSFLHIGEALGLPAGGLTLSRVQRPSIALARSRCGSFADFGAQFEVPVGLPSFRPEVWHRRPEARVWPFTVHLDCCWVLRPERRIATACWLVNSRRLGRTLLSSGLSQESPYPSEEGEYEERVGKERQRRRNRRNRCTPKDTKGCDKEQY